MASDVTVQKELFEQTLGFGTRERVVDSANAGVEIGAWMGVNILGHEMAIMADATGSRGRLHHLAFWYGVPSIELFGNSGILEMEPDFETVTWDLSDFDTALAIGGATLPAETYFVYGTPANPGQDKLLTPWGGR